MYTRVRKHLRYLCVNGGNHERTARGRPSEAAARIVLAPLEDTSTFADRAYTALKDVIVSLNVYEQPGEVRLDERQLAQDLGISRTPVREAMAQLEREGFVRSVPRRGIYVVRKTKREVIEMITAWAALESMAARLITAERDATTRSHRCARMFATFENGDAARQARRVFRGQHRVPPDHHPHEPATACSSIWPRTCSPTCA